MRLAVRERLLLPDEVDDSDGDCVIELEIEIEGVSVDDRVGEIDCVADALCDPLRDADCDCMRNGIFGRVNDTSQRSMRQTHLATNLGANRKSYFAASAT